MQKIRNEEILIKLGENLRRLRTGKNMSQEELALKAGLALSQISRIENGKLNSSISTIIVIAKTLNVHPGELFEKM